MNRPDGLARWCFGLAVACLLTNSLPAHSQIVDWIRQPGLSKTDDSRSVSADRLGNVYISGYISGTSVDIRAGKAGGFLSKFDAWGNLLWTRLRSGGSDDIGSVSADGLGNVFVSGISNYSLDVPSPDTPDVFVSKYDDAGNLDWSRQLGTSGRDESFAASADRLGNVYVSGVTEGSLGGPNAGSYDAFVSKFDISGNLLWTRQFGTSTLEFCYGVSTDGLGNAFVSGSTFGNIGGMNAGNSDAFLSKYDAAGNLLWSRQIGTTGYDEGIGVSADNLGNVFIAGWTDSSLHGDNAGELDAYLSKFDTAGNLLWTRQFGTTASDIGHNVSTDGFGNAFVTGYSAGSLGDPNVGAFDAFVSKFDSLGNLLWTRQLGTAENDWSFGVSADGLGSVYFSGTTYGNLGGPNQGERDAYLVKIADVPEPNSMALASVFAGILMQCGRRWIKADRVQ